MLTVTIIMFSTPLFGVVVIPIALIYVLILVCAISLAIFNRFFCFYIL